MSYQTDLNEFDIQYVRFLSHVRQAIQRTFAEEAKDGLTQKELSETLGIDPALISRRLSGPGNITLRTLSELYTAMGRETLSNFDVPESTVVKEIVSQTSVGDVIVLDSYRHRNTQTSATAGISVQGTATTMTAARHVG